MDIQDIKRHQNRINNLRRLGAPKSVAKAKAAAYAELINTPEENQQWAADVWYGRTTNTHFSTLIAELTK